MDDERREVNRDPGGRRVHGWHWDLEQERRPGFPILGLFLVVFGALLLLEQVFPAFRAAGSAFILAIGLALLVRWAIQRGVGSLYAGAIITGLAAPGVLRGLGVVEGPGLGTLSLGLAFLFVAAVRALSGAGIGWQAWIGGILAVVGGSQVIEPAVGPLIVPALIVILGALLVLRGVGRR